MLNLIILGKLANSTCRKSQCHVLVVPPGIHVSRSNYLSPGTSTLLVDAYIRTGTTACQQDFEEQ